MSRKKNSTPERTGNHSQTDGEFECLEKIRAHMAAFTPRQRAVGEFIIKNPESPAFLSIVELAKKAGVSQATVVRFSNTLGYDGYSQLSGEIRQAIQIEYGSVDRFKLGREIRKQQNYDGDDSFFSRVIASEIDNLMDLTQNLRSSDFYECVDRTLAADQILVLGSYASLSLAIHLHQMLVKVLPRVDLITERSITASARLYNLTPESVVFLISFPRYPKATLELAAMAKKKKAYIYVITNSPNAPGVSVADQTFFISVDVPSFVDAYAAPMAFINALVTEIGIRDPDSARDSLNYFDQYVAELGIFYSKGGEWRPKGAPKSDSEDQSHTKTRRRK